MPAIERLTLDGQPEPVSHYHCCVKNYMKSNVINGLEETATRKKI
jgi:hypothetical protein